MRLCKTRTARTCPLEPVSCIRVVLVLVLSVKLHASSLEQLAPEKKAKMHAGWCRRDKALYWRFISCNLHSGLVQDVTQAVRQNSEPVERHYPAARVPRTRPLDVPLFAIDPGASLHFPVHGAG